MSNYSPEPGTPQSPRKAVLAAVCTFAATALAYWIADADPFTLKDAGEAVLSGAVASGLVGAGTYKIKNRAK